MTGPGERPGDDDDLAGMVDDAMPHIVSEQTTRWTLAVMDNLATCLVVAHLSHPEGDTAEHRDGLAGKITGWLAAIDDTIRAELYRGQAPLPIDRPPDNPDAPGPGLVSAADLARIIASDTLARRTGQGTGEAGP